MPGPHPPFYSLINFVFFFKLSSSSLERRLRPTHASKERQDGIYLPSELSYHSKTRSGRGKEPQGAAARWRRRPQLRPVSSWRPSWCHGGRLPSRSLCPPETVAVARPWLPCPGSPHARASAPRFATNTLAATAPFDLRPSCLRLRVFHSTHFLCLCNAW